MTSLLSLAADLSALGASMADWALMIAGFGGFGAALRSRHSLAAG